MDTHLTRRGGYVAVASGLLGAAAGIALVVVPPAAPVEQFNYPLSPSAFVVAQMVFCVQHLLVAYALWAYGASELGGTSRLATGGRWTAVVSLALLGLWELVAIAGNGLPWPSERTAWIDVGYGLMTIGTGVGMVLLGIATVRARALSGFARWVVLVAGIYVFVPMTPALGAGFVAGRLVLIVWMLLFAGIGWAMLAWGGRRESGGQTSSGSAARRAAV